MAGIASGILRAPMDIMETVIEVVQLSVMFTIFITFFPMLLQLAGMVTGITKNLPGAAKK